MRIEGTASPARIYTGESDHYKGRPLYQALVELLCELDGMVSEGLITLEPVEVSAYRSPQKEERS